MNYFGEYSTSTDFKKRDKSEKVTIVHVEPLKQVIRWTDETFKRFSKILTQANTKKNSILVGMVRNNTEMIDYDTDTFLEDQDGNPFLTGDDQFFKVDL